MTKFRNASLVLALCSACTGSSVKQVGSQYVKTGTFGPSGGTLAVTANDDATLAGTQIVIPPGALSANTLIKIGVTKQPVVSSGALGPVIDFEPPNTTFAQPATVSIPVTLQAGFDPSHVGVMAVESDGTSHDITAVTVAMATSTNGLATFQVSGFTDYGAHDEGDDEHHHDDGGTCTPTCGDDAECGAANGCGGICDHNCHDDAGSGADSGTCTPTCGDGAECGASNGCGGTCDRNCHEDGGSGADSGTCTPTCGGDAACGSSDGCGGTCNQNCTDTCDGDAGQITCSLEGRQYCANPGSDSTNCGACGNTCSPPAQDCINGQCACPDADTLCGEPDAGIPLFCINTTQNTENCGACGNVCNDSYGSNSGCRFGICTCSPGQTRLCGTAGTAGAACVSDAEDCPDGG